jgi:hypothetical protein
MAAYSKFQWVIGCLRLGSSIWPFSAVWPSSPTKFSLHSKLQPVCAQRLQSMLPQGLTKFGEKQARVTSARSDLDVGQYW